MVRQHAADFLLIPDFVMLSVVGVRLWRFTAEEICHGVNKSLQV